MRIAIIALPLLVGLCLPAAAEETDKCAAIGQLAANIMEGRQNGQIMSEAIAAFPADNSARPLGLELVKVAYGRPKWGSDERKSQAVVDFRNEIELACYSGQ